MLDRNAGRFKAIDGIRRQARFRPLDDVTEQVEAIVDESATRAFDELFDDARNVVRSSPVIGSISIFPSMYQSTMVGTSVRPRVGARYTGASNRHRTHRGCTKICGNGSWA